jgi:hypothetical protein
VPQREAIAQKQQQAEVGQIAEITGLTEVEVGRFSFPEAPPTLKRHILDRESAGSTYWINPVFRSTYWINPVFRKREINAGRLLYFCCKF